MLKEEFIKIINGELYYKYDYTYWLYKQLEIRDNIIDKAIEYIEQQRLHKFQDTTGGLTYQERKLLDILKGVDKDGKNKIKKF